MLNSCFYHFYKKSWTWLTRLLDSPSSLVSAGHLNKIHILIHLTQTDICPQSFPTVVKFHMVEHLSRGASSYFNLWLPVLSNEKGQYKATKEEECSSKGSSHSGCLGWILKLIFVAGLDHMLHSFSSLYKFELAHFQYFDKCYSFGLCIINDC